MAELTSKQRAHLRSLAHPLKPLFQVGKDGLTGSSLRAIRQAFQRRELLKVRILDASPDGPRETAEGLAEAIDGASVVQIVGRTATLYRPHPDRPEISLPR